MHRVFLIATMDTKAAEARFFRKELEKRGMRVTLADAGNLSPSPPDAEITQNDVLGGDLEAAKRAQTRADASALIIRGLKRVTLEQYQSGRLDAAVSFGGSGGTALAAAAMSVLPLGVPKVIVSTIASGNTQPYLHGRDILLINPIADLQSLNPLTRHALAQAAAIVAAMLTVPPADSWIRPAIAISGFGVTTPCVDACVEALDAAGYDSIVFHARGDAGGKLMEEMIAQDRFAGVLDLTTSEITDEVCGGIYAVGEQRLRTAAERGVPYVVTPGALEMINLGSEDTLTDAQRKRVLYRHSPSSVKMRANSGEMRQCARVIAQRLGQSWGNVAFLAAERGFSAVNAEGRIFYDSEANAAFLEEIEALLPDRVPVTVLDCHHNDRVFAEACFRTLMKLIADKKEGSV